MRRARGQRGAASFEALLVITFFILIWVLAFFVQKTFSKKLVVNERARSCAWERMTSGCRGPVSARCALGAGPALSDDQLEGSRGSMVEIERIIREGFTVDFRGRFGPAFRPVFAASSSGEVRRPRSLGGGLLGLTTTMSAMCNEVGGPETVQAITNDSFCAETGWCP